MKKNIRQLYQLYCYAMMMMTMKIKMNVLMSIKSNIIDVVIISIT